MGCKRSILSFGKESVIFLSIFGVLLGFTYLAEYIYNKFNIPDNAISLSTLSRQEHLIKDTKSYDYNLLHGNIDIVSYNSFNPSLKDSQENSIKDYEINPEFENLFLADMTKLGYFELVDENYVPTKKFIITAEENPKELLDINFTLVKNKLSYDNEKVSAKDGKYVYGTSCYKIEKGICSDYVAISSDGWKVLQMKYPRLSAIEVFYVGGGFKFSDNHAWNGIKCGNQVTFVDTNGDDYIPHWPRWLPFAPSLDAVDDTHWFYKK